MRTSKPTPTGWASRPAGSLGPHRPAKDGIRFRPRARTRRWPRLFSHGLSCAVLTAVAVGCSKPGNRPTPSTQGGALAVPVATGTAIRTNVPLELQAIGTARAFASVAVKARVDGQLSNVAFRQGDEVRKGDLILRIDSRTYQAMANEAEAVLARDQASLEYAIVDMQRTDALADTKAVSASVVDANRAKVASLRASVEADKAALENARLLLSFCSITSPVDGRMGLLQLDEGNMVKNNDTVLAVVNQTRPIYVDFSVPEQFLPEVRTAAAAGPLQVEASAPHHASLTVTGSLEVINNEVDSSTGTILLRARFDNEGEQLWPGQFLNVTLKLGELPNAVVVPSEAVQSSQDGEFIFVVQPDETVAKRAIKPGRTRKGSTVIEDGIDAGETVVTDGQMRLVPGAKVRLAEPSSTASPEDGGSA